LASPARIGSAALGTQCVGGEADPVDEQGGVVMRVGWFRRCENAWQAVRGSVSSAESDKG
jgi:hypothetical protein